MKIYVKESEMPKCCGDCSDYYEDYNNRNRCYFTSDILTKDYKCNDTCPLRSIEAHNADIRKQTAREIIRKIQDEMTKLCIFCHNSGYDAGTEGVEIFWDGLEGDISNFVSDDLKKLSEQYEVEK